MERLSHRKNALILGCAVTLVLGTGAIAGCTSPSAAPDAGESVTPIAQTGEDENAKPTDYIEGIGLQNVFDAKAQRAQDWAPKVVTLDDGRQVQRTPDSPASYWYSDGETAFNTFTLNADNRGCDSCHQEGLAELLKKDTTLMHWPLDNNLGTNVNALDCLMCHNEHKRNHNGITNSFGDVIHGIHSKESFTGDCMSCHTATADGNGLRLWEESRYEVLHGINKVEDVTGDFYFEQETLGGDTTMALWPGLDEDMWVRGFSDEQHSDEFFNNWEITVSGMVDNPYVITLGELIEEAPSVTFISSGQCIVNPPGGEQLCNVEVTGVPISWFVEKAQPQAGATTVTTCDPQGGHLASPIEDFLGENPEDGWIIYKVNGEYLNNPEGYPCRAWFPEHGISLGRKATAGILIDDGPIRADEGAGILNGAGGPGSWSGDPDDPSIEFANKPNVGICDTPEGLIIPINQPYEFKGFADAFNEQVIAMEFSMDGGNTWTRYDTSDSNKIAWVYWHFTWTPEETGAYVLQARGISLDENGNERVSRTADRVMVNVK